MFLLRVLVTVGMLTLVGVPSAHGADPIAPPPSLAGRSDTEVGFRNGAPFVTGRVNGSPGSTRPGSTSNSGTGASNSQASGGGGSSSAAARAAAAAAFAACEAEAQAELAAGGAAPTCGFIPAAAAGGGAAPGALAGPAIDPGVLARQALLQLPIPMPQAQIGPPPSINEWNMAAVGYPLWLWTDDPDSHTTTVTEQGITLTLQATRRTTRFDLGDGTRTFCAVTAPWHPGIEPGTPSPACGHVYRQPSPPGGTYAVTATTVWDIAWAALGQTGTLEFERTGAATPLPVGELHALRTG